MVNDYCGVDGGIHRRHYWLLSLVIKAWGDLFVVERICKPLWDVVVGDPVLWRKINIVHPFCTNITNDILINLTNTAQIHLYSFNLFHRSKLTDVGLKLKGQLFLLCFLLSY